jgi:hypothetical protein
MCPKCERKRFREKVIKKGKRNFMVRECLGCATQYSLIRVRKSTLTNEWIEIEDK